MTFRRSLAAWLVLSERAADALAGDLAACGRLHPIVIGGTRWCALEVTLVADCLDRKRSALEVFDGTIEAFDRLALRPRSIPVAPFFWIKGLDDLELFCGGRLFRNQPRDPSVRRVSVPESVEKPS